MSVPVHRIPFEAMRLQCRRLSAPRWDEMFGCWYAVFRRESVLRLGSDLPVIAAGLLTFSSSGSVVLYGRPSNFRDRCAT